MRPRYVIAAAIGLLALLLFVLLTKRGAEAPQASPSGQEARDPDGLGSPRRSTGAPTSSEPEEPARIPMKGGIRETRQLMRWQDQGQAESADPEKLYNGPDDPVAVELLTALSQAGRGLIVTKKPGSQELRHEDALLFEARIIHSASFAEEGSVAVGATLGTGTPIMSADASFEGGRRVLHSSPREVWVVSPTGKRTRISPPSMDAYLPLLSPDGSRIAFTGRELDSNGFPSEPRLYVGNVLKGSYQSYGVGQEVSGGFIRAADWQDEGRCLRVLFDHGEVGGHLQFMQVKPDWEN